MVELSVDDAKTVHLIVEDDGPGYEVGAAGGMGSKLINGFVGQLGGTLEVGTGSGTKVVVSFPLD